MLKFIGNQQYFTLLQFFGRLQVPTEKRKYMGAQQ